MSSPKAVSMDSSPVGLLSFAAPEMFPLAPMIHRGAQKGDHSTRGMARWGLEGWPFWGAKSRKGALPSFGLSMFFAQLWCWGGVFLRLGLSFRWSSRAS